MNVSPHRFSKWTSFAVTSAILLVLTSCEGSGSKAAANAGGASHSNNPEVFAISPRTSSRICRC
jgi:hypothetical protein